MTDRDDQPDEQPPSRGEMKGALKQLYRMYTQARTAQIEFEATLKAVVDALAAAGLLPLAEFERRRSLALDKLSEDMTEEGVVKIAKPVDKYALKELPQIDCASLIHLCKARCCALKVCLSQQDIDEGVLSWDYEQPYQIRRRREDEYCVYSEPETRRCIVYAHRPATCRTYDCREDPRIWKDFDKKIPATFGDP
jgi:Fe-S-cluster containining protein